MLTAEDWRWEVQIDTKITTENKLLIMRGDYFGVQMWKMEEIIEALCMEPTRTNVKYGPRERETDTGLRVLICAYAEHLRKQNELKE